MPYFVFAVQPFAAPDRLADFAAYAEASAHAKALRAAQEVGTNVRIRIMFAADPLSAEDLLLQLRTAGPGGDE
jgi:hypothetical protein